MAFGLYAEANENRLSATIQQRNPQTPNTLWTQKAIQNNNEIHKPQIPSEPKKQFKTTTQSTNPKYPLNPKTNSKQQRTQTPNTLWTIYKGTMEFFNSVPSKGTFGFYT